MYLEHKPYVEAALAFAQYKSYGSLTLLKGNSVGMSDILEDGDLTASIHVSYTAIESRLASLGVSLVTKLLFEHEICEFNQDTKVFKFRLADRSVQNKIDLDLGVATQFLLSTDSNANDNRSCYSFILGSVGPIGSGADLELIDTDIKAGIPILLNNLEFKLT